MYSDFTCLDWGHFYFCHKVPKGSHIAGGALDHGLFSNDPSPYVDFCGRVTMLELCRAVCSFSNLTDVMSCSFNDDSSLSDEVEFGSFPSSNTSGYSNYLHSGIPDYETFSQWFAGKWVPLASASWTSAPSFPTADNCSGTPVNLMRYSVDFPAWIYWQRKRLVHTMFDESWDPDELYFGEGNQFNITKDQAYCSAKPVSGALYVYSDESSTDVLGFQSIRVVPNATTYAWQGYHDADADSGSDFDLGDFCPGSARRVTSRAETTGAAKRAFPLLVDPTLGFGLPNTTLDQAYLEVAHLQYANRLGRLLEMGYLEALRLRRAATVLQYYVSHLGLVINGVTPAVSRVQEREKRGTRTKYFGDMSASRPSLYVDADLPSVDTGDGESFDEWTSSKFVEEGSLGSGSEDESWNSGEHDRSLSDVTSFTLFSFERTVSIEARRATVLREFSDYHEETKAGRCEQEASGSDWYYNTEDPYARTWLRTDQRRHGPVLIRQGGKVQTQYSSFLVGKPSGSVGISPPGELNYMLYLQDDYPRVSVSASVVGGMGASFAALGWYRKSDGSVAPGLTRARLWVPVTFTYRLKGGQYSFDFFGGTEEDSYSMDESIPAIRGTDLSDIHETAKEYFSTRTFLAPALWTAPDPQSVSPSDTIRGTLTFSVVDRWGLMQRLLPATYEAPDSLPIEFNETSYASGLMGRLPPLPTTYRTTTYTILNHCGDAELTVTGTRVVGSEDNEAPSWRAITPAQAPGEDGNARHVYEKRMSCSASHRFSETYVVTVGGGPSYYNMWAPANDFERCYLDIVHNLMSFYGAHPFYGLV